MGTVKDLVFLVFIVVLVFIGWRNTSHQDNRLFTTVKEFVPGNLFDAGFKTITFVNGVQAINLPTVGDPDTLYVSRDLNRFFILDTSITNEDKPYLEESDQYLEIPDPREFISDKDVMYVVSKEDLPFTGETGRLYHVLSEEGIYEWISFDSDGDYHPVVIKVPSIPE